MRLLLSLHGFLKKQKKKNPHFNIKHSQCGFVCLMHHQEASNEKQATSKSGEPSTILAIILENHLFAPPCCRCELNTRNIWGGSRRISSDCDFNLPLRVKNQDDLSACQAAEITRPEGSYLGSHEPMVERYGGWVRAGGEGSGVCGGGYVEVCPHNLIPRGRFGELRGREGPESA